MKNERMFRLERYNRPVNAFCARLFFFYLFTKPRFHASATFQLQRQFIYEYIFIFTSETFFKNQNYLAFHEQHSPIYWPRSVWKVRNDVKDQFSLRGVCHVICIIHQFWMTLRIVRGTWKNHAPENYGSRESRKLGRNMVSPAARSGDRDLTTTLFS